MRPAVWTRRGVLLVAIATLCAACGLVPLPGQGECTLDVSTDTNDGLAPLASPYVVDLPRPGGADHLSISLSGSGFRDARLIVIGPTGLMEEDSPRLEEYLNETSVAFVVDQPGAWRVHVGDPVASCTFDFTVQARPTG
jgi:hypothetical protein